MSSNPTPPGNEQLPDQLHLILREWSQLILSLASLIRENVEGLLPAVFGLANLAHRASEARMHASGGAREAGASLRDRASELRAALSPLGDAARDGDELRGILEDLAAQASGLLPLVSQHPELGTFLDSLAHGKTAAMPRVMRLLDTSRAVQVAGTAALEQLESGLDTVDKLLHADTSGLEEAAARVKHFAESSKAAIDSLLVKLQFQDRTDQILQHLLKDFESLSSALSVVGDQPFDADSWLQERQKRFTTAEERNVGSAPSVDSGDIELF